MDNRQIIQNSIDYIEENLKTEITANELADLAGYSVFYFYRLFQSTVGIPVMQYVLQRKLLNAIFDISCGKKKIDIALEFGFSSYASFYKAFKREIGYTPSEFLKKFKVNKPVNITLFKDGDLMITHKTLSDVLKNWNIEDKTIKDIYYSNSGRRNETAFYVGEDYIIKASRDLGRIKKQVELASAMKNSGLYSANVIPTTGDNYYIESNNLHFCLTTRLKGEHLKPQDFYKPDSNSLAEFVGENVAKLHLSLSKIEEIVDDVNMFEIVTNWALPKAEMLIDIPKDILKSYIEMFGKIHISLPRQIIHRDPNPGNIIVNGKQCGFIDFELSERNLRIFDPCYAATAILSETFSDNGEEIFNQWINVYKNIIHGYDKVIKLTEEELQSLPYVVLSNQLVCIAYFSQYSKYENILNTNIHMTKIILDNFEKLKI